MDDASDVEGLAREISDLVVADGSRVLIGITGAPGSGKSTLADGLAAAVPGAVVLPMDGFHLDDGILSARGHLPRKGAPHTFDADGFAAILARVRAGGLVYAPAFDRDLEISRAGAIEIGPEVRVVLVEGNYLLHDQEGWEAVRPMLDQCWFLDVAEAELRRRLEARWRGYDLDETAIGRKLEENDLPNARFVAGMKGRADRVLR